MNENTLSMVNLGYLKETCGGSQDMVDQIIRMFLDTTPGLIAEMKQNLHNDQRDDLKRNAHKAKSSFLILGAKITGEKLQQIEHGAGSSLHQELGQLLSEVEDESNAILHLLSKT